MRRFLLLIAIISLPFAVAAQSNDHDDIVTQTLETCLAGKAGRAEVGSCAGIALVNCEARFGDPAVIPRICWEEELAVWDHLLNASYQALIEDITPTYAEFEDPIRDAQRNWVRQRELDCALQVASNPRTYDVILTACRARMTMERALFLRDLMGADWTHVSQ